MFPIFEYCCLNCVCKPFQSKAIGLSDSYHNLPSPTNVKQYLSTLTPSGNAWKFIKSFVLRWCASASSSGLPANASLKWDQFNCGTGPGCTGGAAGCAGGAGVVVVLVVLHQPRLFISYVWMII